MLSLKEPRAGYSKYWTVRGTYLGLSVNRSTKATDKKTAEKYLKAIKAEIERRAFEPKVKGGGMPFVEAARRYVREHPREERIIARLEDYFGRTPIADIDQQRLEDAAYDMLPHATNATRNRAVFTPVSAVLRHAGVERRFRRPEGANGEERTFWMEPEQAERLLAEGYAYRHEFGLLLEFLLYTGCRLNEALRLETKSVSLQEARAFVSMTKNGKPRLVHLPHHLVAALANHPRGMDRDGRVFSMHAGGKLNKRLKEAAERAGVEMPPGVAFHAFRHTWGAWMRRYGKLDTTGLVATGAWLSHAAARRYEHAVATEAAERANLLPVVGGERTFSRAKRV